jgi:hypothetical protein
LNGQCVSNNGCWNNTVTAKADTARALLNFDTTTYSCVVGVDEKCFESNAYVAVTDTKGRRSSNGACVTKLKTECIKSDGTKDTMIETVAQDKHGSCQTVTNAQCWDTATSAKLSRSADRAFDSGTFQCKAVTATNCWEGNANVPVTASKGRSPKAADGGACVALKATECVGSDGVAATINVATSP